jgi:hypothetical protein
MANETDQVSWSNAAGLQIGEALGGVPLPANLPKIVLLGLVNHDSLVGQPTETKRYSKFSDLGAASAVAEGTDATTNVELTMGTAIDISVAENAVIKSTISDRALERMVPGRTGVDAIFQSQNPAALVSALGPQAQRHMSMALEKVEADLKDLLSSLSNSVGGGATVDLRVSDLLDAIYTYQTLDPVSDAGFYLSPHQMHEIRKELATTGGGLGGSVWTNADSSGFLANPDNPSNGFQGSFLGRPVYEGAHSLREEASSAAWGMYGALGMGSAPDVMGATVSPFAFVEGRAGFTHYVDFNASNRWTELVTILVFGVGEIKDDAAVGITSDDA